MLQFAQQAFGKCKLRVLFHPYLRQALVGRQLAHHRAEEFALHRGGDAVFAKRMHPERCDREIGRLGETAHGAQAGESVRGDASPAAPSYGVAGVASRARSA